MSKKQISQHDAQANKSPNVFLRFATYVEESRAELKKVNWPTLKETRRASIVVLLFVTAMAIILGLVDLGLSTIIQLILP